jgi:uncharacterized membrane protein YdjX (TVP38/TMEM64 family)
VKGLPRRGGGDFVPHMTARRWLLLVLGLAGLAAAWAIVYLDLSHLDPESIATQVRAAGPLGSLALFALLVIQCIVAPLPSEPLMMAAGFVYGATGGFLIAWLGVVGGATACFALARVFGRPFAARFVSAQKLAMLDSFDGVQARTATFVAVLSLRLFAFTAFDVVSYACGLISFPFRWFLLATALGGVPKVFAFTYFGANVSERPGWLGWLITAGTFGVLLLVPWMLRAWRRARVEATSHS